MTTVTFADLGLSPKVQQAISAAGYSNPTPIQAAAIPVAVTGRDVLGIAQTGTGKTASFTLPMITRLETGRARARMPRSLILAPTRELAAQVAQSFEKYGVNHKLDVALLIGGVSMDDQVRKLDRGVDVLIATPGRLLDHFQRGRVMLMGVEIFVIDEADRMLDMGFIPDIEKICRLLPPRRQTLFFSATMPPEITRLVNTFLKDPTRIEVAKPATTAKTITQRFQFCADGEDWAKREMLREVIRTNTVKNAIIFCNRKRDVAILYKSLAKHGFNAGALHGDMDQKSRMETLDRFRSGDIMLLAASDVAARGLDIPDVSHVFNFDLPWAADDYVHRIGRTGRAGKEGTSISLVGPDDLKFLTDIEKITGEKPTWIGSEPSADDFESSGKRRRGRSGGGKGRGGRDSQSASTSSPRRDGRGDGRDGGGRRNGQDGRDGDRTQRPPRPPRDTTAAQSPDAPTAATDVSAPPASDSPSGGGRDRREGGERDANAARGQRGGRSRRGGAREAQGGGAMDAPKSTAPAAKPAPKRDDWTDPKPAVPAPQQAKAKSTKPQQPQGQKNQAVGFAENVPAFLRRPTRPTKIPGRGG